METWEWVALAAGIAVVLLVLLALVAWMRGRRRRAQLKERFGSEYDRTVSDLTLQVEEGEIKDILTSLYIQQRQPK